MDINSKNVGRIAERIAMNELEARGFHIIDLAYMSKTSANVDFIASKSGKSYNIQVKGSSAPPLGSNARWGVHYGYCNDDIVENGFPVFNGKADFALKAQVIILLAVQAPTHYRAIVMPVEVAEEAAQLNMSGYYRLAKLGGGKRKPNKLWVHLEAARKPRKLNELQEKERRLLKRYEGAWDSLGGLLDGLIDDAGTRPDPPVSIRAPAP
jgi:hypothetical protein